MTHQQLLDSAALYALDALDGEERAAFEAHLPGCEECRSEVASYRNVVGLLAYAAPPKRPANEAALRERLVTRARQAPPISRARSWSLRTPRAAWTAAAACLVLAAASGLAYRAEHGKRARLESELASERAALALRDSTIAAFLGPEVHVVSLSVPEHKPSARVFWNHTRNVFIVTAFDLPTAPSGKTYQLWALAKGKAPVSMGTFNTDPRGRVATVLPVGKDIAESGFIDDCGLTVEPAGGSPQPTESPRLIGTWRHVD
jgi:anti-sigma-K factor RskA